MLLLRCRLVAVAIALGCCCRMVMAPDPKLEKDRPLVIKLENLENIHDSRGLPISLHLAHFLQTPISLGTHVYGHLLLKLNLLDRGEDAISSYTTVWGNMWNGVMFRPARTINDKPAVEFTLQDRVEAHSKNVQSLIAQIGSQHHAQHQKPEAGSIMLRAEISVLARRYPINHDCEQTDHVSKPLDIDRQSQWTLDIVHLPAAPAHPTHTSLEVNFRHVIKLAKLTDFKGGMISPTEKLSPLVRMRHNHWELAFYLLPLKSDPAGACDSTPSPFGYPAH